METFKEITINGYELNCRIDFSRFRDTHEDESEIVINTIYWQNIEVSNLVSATEMERLKERCEETFQNEQLHWMMERSEQMDREPEV